MRYDTSQSRGSDRLVERYWCVTYFALANSGGKISKVVIHPEEVTSFVDERLRQGSSTHPQPAQLVRAIETVFSSELERLQNITAASQALIDAVDIDHIAYPVIREGREVALAQAATFVFVEGERATILNHSGFDPAVIEDWSVFTIVAGSEPFSDVMLSKRKSVPRVASCTSRRLPAPRVHNEGWPIPRMVRAHTAAWPRHLRSYRLLLRRRE